MTRGQKRDTDQSRGFSKRLRLIEQGIDPDTGQMEFDLGVKQEPRQAEPRDPDKVRDGYDPVAWAMAEEFLNHARRNRVPVKWGVPYLAKMFFPGVAASGLLSGGKILDGDRREIAPAEAAIRLVRYFWDKDMWAYECSTGESVAYRFAEPSNMRSWYMSLRRYWHRRRVQKFGTVTPSPDLHRNPDTPRREN